MLYVCTAETVRRIEDGFFFFRVIYFKYLRIQIVRPIQLQNFITTIKSYWVVRIVRRSNMISKSQGFLTDVNWNLENSWKNTTYGLIFLLQRPYSRGIKVDKVKLFRKKEPSLILLYERKKNVRYWFTITRIPSREWVRAFYYLVIPFKFVK